MLGPGRRCAVEANAWGRAVTEKRCGTCGWYLCTDHEDRDPDGNLWGECKWKLPQVADSFDDLRRRKAYTMCEARGTDCPCWKPREEPEP